MYPGRQKVKKALLLAGGLGLILGMGISQGAFAQGVTALADQVQKAYEGTQDLKMDFTQETYVEVLEKEVTKSGQITLKKPGKFLIQYSGPRGRRYVSDGKKLWVYIRGDRQVQVYALSDKRVPTEALSFLGGLGNLKQDFAVETVEEKKWKALGEKNPGLQWLELTPIKRVSQIKWLVMGFDPQTHLAQEIFLLTQSGNLTHYRMKDLSPNTGVEDGLFKFKEKGVVEVKPK